MKFLRSTILFCLLTISIGFAKEVYFKNPYTLWKDADILIWSTDKQIPIDPKEFCLSLKRSNYGIGNPKCRSFGEWERDSIALHYANWLQYNLEPGLSADYLKARHPAMIAKFATLDDKIVLFLSTSGNKIKLAIFDETAAQPKIAAAIDFNDDKIALGDEIADNFFRGTTKRRLSKEERLKIKTEPDEYYKEVPDFRGWFGISIGYAQAKIPLTPDNWYRSHVNSKVRKYRVTKDSTSLWNFIDDSDPFLSLYAGGIWYGFIGGEIIYRFAKHSVKTDNSDTLYKELDHWDFSQHEIGLNVILSKTCSPLKWLDISPFFFLGFQYSFFVEDIDVKSGIKEPSQDYKTRVKFEDAYKGALVGFGSQFVFAKHYGIGLRTGLSSRGRNIYSDPSPDAAAEPTTIGASTIDWFISVGLEYHLNI